MSLLARPVRAGVGLLAALSLCLGLQMPQTAAQEPVAIRDLGRGSGQLSGTVFDDATGEPVAAAEDLQLSLWRWQGFLKRAGGVKLPAGTSRFSLRGLAPGTYAVCLYGDGDYASPFYDTCGPTGVRIQQFDEPDGTIVVDGGQATRDLLVIKRPPFDATLSGRTVGPDASAQGIHVTPLWYDEVLDDFVQVGGAYVGPDGSWSFQVPAGDVRVAASTQDGRRTTATFDRVSVQPGPPIAARSGENITVDLDFAPSGTAVASGTFTDPNKAPGHVTLGDIALVPWDAGLRRFVRERAILTQPALNGRWKLPPLAPGPYYIVASATWAESASVDPDLAPTDPRDPDVIMLVAGENRIDYTLPLGRPVAVTTTKLKLSRTTAPRGTAVHARAVISSDTSDPSYLPYGRVVFRDGRTRIGSAPVASRRHTAGLRLRALGPGRHRIRARFVPAVAWQRASTSRPAVLQVNP